jgi:hypothetical protein
MYSAPPQSFPTRHSSASDNTVKDESSYFATSAANGVGTSSSTMSDWKLPFDSYQKVETDSDDNDDDDDGV